MYRTIPELTLTAADRDPDGVWLRTDDLAITFGEAARWVGAAVERIRAAGVGSGDRVLFAPRNTPVYLITWLAVTSSGAIAVTANPAGSADELAGLAAQTRPRLTITDDTVDDVVGPAPTPGEPLTSTLHPQVRPDDVAVLIPTSGTTGRAKLVMQTHRAYVMAGEGFPWWLDLTASDRLMTSLPLFHINAPAYSVLGSLACGAGLVLLPRFSASGFLDAARRHGATEFNAIGAMLEILLRQPERPDDADTPLRLAYAGPTPPEEGHLAFERRFGLRLTSGYALSESPYGLVWHRGERPYGALGRPRQHPVLGEVNESRLEDGELLLRNPTVTPGYWGMPGETAAAITEDGWLRTGDLVTENPDGTYTFVARRKEVIRRRGENLSPLEVEAVLVEHPAVLEAAVIGIPSELSEEEVKAFVVATDDVQLDVDELREWVGARLAAFKVPQHWQQLPALPRTPTNRVAKHQLPRGAV